MESFYCNECQLQLKQCRFKCLHCCDYDLCENCSGIFSFNDKNHQANHVLLKLELEPLGDDVGEEKKMNHLQKLLLILDSFQLFYLDVEAISQHSKLPMEEVRSLLNEVLEFEDNLVICEDYIISDDLFQCNIGAISHSNCLLSRIPMIDIQWQALVSLSNNFVDGAEEIYLLDTMLSSSKINCEKDRKSSRRRKRMEDIEFNAALLIYTLRSFDRLVGIAEGFRRQPDTQLILYQAIQEIMVCSTREFSSARRTLFKVVRELQSTKTKTLLRTISHFRECLIRQLSNVAGCEFGLETKRNPKKPKRQQIGEGDVCGNAKDLDPIVSSISTGERLGGSVEANLDDDDSDDSVELAPKQFVDNLPKTTRRRRRKCSGDFVAADDSVDHGDFIAKNSESNDLGTRVKNVLNEVQSNHTSREKFNKRDTTIECGQLNPINIDNQDIEADNESVASTETTTIAPKEFIDQLPRRTKKKRRQADTENMCVAKNVDENQHNNLLLNPIPRITRRQACNLQQFTTSSISPISVTKSETTKICRKQKLARNNVTVGAPNPKKRGRKKKVVSDHPSAVDALVNSVAVNALADMVESSTAQIKECNAERSNRYFVRIGSSSVNMDKDVLTNLSTESQIINEAGIETDVQKVENDKLCSCFSCMTLENLPVQEVTETIDNRQVTDLPSFTEFEDVSTPGVELLNAPSQIPILATASTSAAELNDSTSPLSTSADFAAKQGRERELSGNNVVIEISTPKKRERELKHHLVSTVVPLLIQFDKADELSESKLVYDNAVRDVVQIKNDSEMHDLSALRADEMPPAVIALEEIEDRQVAVDNDVSTNLSEKVKPEDFHEHFDESVIEPSGLKVVNSLTSERAKLKAKDIENQDIEADNESVASTEITTIAPKEFIDQLPRTRRKLRQGDVSKSVDENRDSALSLISIPRFTRKMHCDNMSSVKNNLIDDKCRSYVSKDPSKKRGRKKLEKKQVVTPLEASLDHVVPIVLVCECPESKPNSVVDEVETNECDGSAEIRDLRVVHDSCSIKELSHVDIVLEDIKDRHDQDVSRTVSGELNSKDFDECQCDEFESSISVDNVPVGVHNHESSTEMPNLYSSFDSYSCAVEVVGARQAEIDKNASPSECQQWKKNVIDNDDREADTESDASSEAPTIAPKEFIDQLPRRTRKKHRQADTGEVEDENWENTLLLIPIPRTTRRQASNLHPTNTSSTPISVTKNDTAKICRKQKLVGAPNSKKRGRKKKAADTMMDCVPVAVVSESSVDGCGTSFDAVVHLAQINERNADAKLCNHFSAHICGSENNMDKDVSTNVCGTDTVTEFEVESFDSSKLENSTEIAVMGTDFSAVWSSFLIPIPRMQRDSANDSKSNLMEEDLETSSDASTELDVSSLKNVATNDEMKTSGTTLDKSHDSVRVLNLIPESNVSEGVNLEAACPEAKVLSTIDDSLVRFPIEYSSVVDTTLQPAMQSKFVHFWKEETESTILCSVVKESPAEGIEDCQDREIKYVAAMNDPEEQLARGRVKKRWLDDLEYSDKEKTEEISKKAATSCCSSNNTTNSGLEFDISSVMVGNIYTEPSLHCAEETPPNSTDSIPTPESNLVVVNKTLVDVPIVQHHLEVDDGLVAFNFIDQIGDQTSVDFDRTSQPDTVDLNSLKSGQEIADLVVKEVGECSVLQQSFPEEQNFEEATKISDADDEVDEELNIIGDAISSCGDTVVKTLPKSVWSNGNLLKLYPTKELSQLSSSMDSNDSNEEQSSTSAACVDKKMRKVRFNLDVVIHHFSYDSDSDDCSFANSQADSREIDWLLPTSFTRKCSSGRLDWDLQVDTVASLATILENPCEENDGEDSSCDNNSTGNNADSDSDSNQSLKEFDFKVEAGLADCLNLPRYSLFQDFVDDP